MLSTRLMYPYIVDAMPECLNWFGCINLHLVLWLEIASILIDVLLVVCYNPGNHEVTNEFAAADTTGD